MRYRIKLTLYYLDLEGNELKNRKTFEGDTAEEVVKKRRQFVANLKFRKITLISSVGGWICGK